VPWRATNPTAGTALDGKNKRRRAVSVEVLFSK